MNSLIYPMEGRPRGSEPIVIEEGLLWFSLPLPMALDHVNVYALQDTDGWTIIDTGIGNEATGRIWQDIIDNHLQGDPVKRIILTHHHPDHVGMAGWFKSRYNPEMLSSRTAWLMTRMLVLDVQDVPVPASIDFLVDGGMGADRLEEIRTRRPFNFADCVHPIPPGYTRLSEGNVLEMGGNKWTIRTGDGHAPEQLTFWRSDGAMVIGGDQFLADITPNIGVHPNEPGADPLEEWLTSCRRFAAIADDKILVLPGHKSPFRGLSVRLNQYLGFHRDCLARLTSYLEQPRTTIECFEILFGRRIPEREFTLALAEAVAHLNHLLFRGVVCRKRGAGGAWMWQAR